MRQVATWENASSKNEEDGLQELCKSNNFVCVLISERSSSTKVKLNESTKRNAWMSLRDTSSWWATNSEECDVVWRNRYFCFLARLASLLLKPWCTMIEQGDTTHPAVDFSEPSEAMN